MTTAPSLQPAPPSVRHVEVLNRLDPDLLHPARLAGPHAWHPWGLTRHDPTDHDIRLVVPPGRNVDAQIERISDSLAEQLTGPSWPPAPRLNIEQAPGRLTCRLLGEPVSQITIHAATWDRGSLPDRGTDHYTRSGWPIIDQHAAFADRIHAIDPTRPDPADLADLTAWIEATMDAAASRRHSAGLASVLDQHGRLAPRSLNRLEAILDAHSRLEQSGAAHCYLAEAIARSRQHAEARSRRSS